MLPFGAWSRVLGLQGRLQIGRNWIRCVVLRLGTAIFALLLVLHVLRLTGYDSVLTRLLAAVRHLLKFSVHWG